MKLRHFFIITFCLIVIIPMSLFWMWPYSKALESEVKGVNEKHLVIAKNLSVTFERYYQDVIGIFSILSLQSQDQIDSPAFKDLLASYQFTQAVMIDDNGAVKHCLFYSVDSCPQKIDDDILNLAKKSLQKGSINLSTVTEDKRINSGPIFLVVSEYNDNILLAYLSTKYIVEMGKRVAFGEKGHAAIVDQAGNVLAHPLDSWVQQRKNISSISAVQKMLAGETGVEKFYSPALKGDMIAGYTFVDNAKWGVMVPQPIKELEDKAREIDETAILVMLLGLGLALLITIPVSFVLINPLENLLRVIKLIEKRDSTVNFRWKFEKVIPLEIREIKESFSNMMNNIEKNKKSISKLAYFDSNTGLPNRNFFYQLSTKSLQKMLKMNKKAALVFIDFDDFKAVNDTYGHKMGDELLCVFGQRLTKYFSLNDNANGKDSCAYDGSIPEVIVARLGGDEFVLLLQDIKDKATVKLIIDGLFKKVFSEYHLQDEIKLTLTGSAGIALFPEHGKTYEELLKLADISMYEAKSAGKNRLLFSQ